MEPHLQGAEVRVCYEMNASIPQKFVCWNLTPNVIVVGSRDLWEVIEGDKGKFPINGICALTK